MVNFIKLIKKNLLRLTVKDVPFEREGTEVIKNFVLKICKYCCVNS